jgi:hypothetical protein
MEIKLAHIEIEITSASLKPYNNNPKISLNPKQVFIEIWMDFEIVLTLLFEILRILSFL